MLGMMSNKGGQNSAVPGQQQGGMADLAAMFRSNAPMGGMGQGAMPGQGALPQIMAPQRPTFAPPPRLAMPQAAPTAPTGGKSFRDMVIEHQMNRGPRRSEK